MRSLPAARPYVAIAFAVPRCSGRPSENAIEKNVDGEAEPLVAIAGDHLRGVGDDQRKAIRR